MTAPASSPLREAIGQIEALIIAIFPLVEAMPLPADPDDAENFNRGMILLDIAQMLATKAIQAADQEAAS